MVLHLSHCANTQCFQAELLSLKERISLLDLERTTLADQKRAIESELEVKMAQFAEEKKFLEDIVADVRGADERSVRAQEDIHQELRAEAQRTHVRIMLHR